MIIHNLNRNSPKITQITQTRSLKILNYSTVNDKTQNSTNLVSERNAQSNIKIRSTI